MVFFNIIRDQVADFIDVGVLNVVPVVEQLLILIDLLDLQQVNGTVIFWGLLRWILNAFVVLFLLLVRFLPIILLLNLLG